MKYKPGGIHLNKSDLMELILLLDMCNMTYGKGKELKDDLYELYIDRFNEEPHRNVRGAGRKKVYDKDKEDEIKGLRKQGHTIREIAATVHTSESYVHKVISIK